MPDPVDLPDDKKLELEQRLDEFEALLKEPGADPHMWVLNVVGEQYASAATAHIIGLRIAAMRSSAKAKGFNVGI